MTRIRPISQESDRFARNPADLPGVRKICHGSDRFPRNSPDFPGIPQICHELPIIQESRHPFRILSYPASTPHLVRSPPGAAFDPVHGRKPAKMCQNAENRQTQEKRCRRNIFACLRKCFCLGAHPEAWFSMQLYDCGMERNRFFRSCFSNGRPRLIDFQFRSIAPDWRRFVLGVPHS